MRHEVVMVQKVLMDLVGIRSVYDPKERLGGKKKKKRFCNKGSEIILRRNFEGETSVRSTSGGQM